MNQKRLKILRSLSHSRFRRLHRLFLVEGEHAVEELLKSSWPVESVMAVDDPAFGKLKSLKRGISLELVSKKILDRIATTGTPQDILAVAHIPEIDLAAVGECQKIIIADGIKDPGNMGTIIRTAESFGFGAVATTAGSVDVFNPKVVRATQGSMFHMKIAQRVRTRDIIDKISRSHTLYSLIPNGEIDIRRLRISPRSALVIGSEIHGVSQDLLSASAYAVRLPISGRSESLNAAVAAGIAMFFFNPA